MTRDLARLLKPKTIALFGGAWAGNVASQLKKTGFDGKIFPVHPNRDAIEGFACYASIEELPLPPDAAFIGVNRQASVEIVKELAQMGAGGAICFASGFSESEGEAAGGAALQGQLIEAAGDMPILGPNCYGLLNYLDNVTLWPDEHGGRAVKKGVGIIAQSSNIAINMSMQARGLFIGAIIAAGNQAQTGIAEIGEALLADARISAIGLYLEGFGDIRALEAFAIKARKAKKPVVVLKIGRSAKARAGTMTHTASLAGGAAASSALVKRLGFIEVQSISVFLETLKLLDISGPLCGNAICSVSCSGGEAGLMADLSQNTRLDFRDFSKAKIKALKAELGPIVTIANPLDYHTFIWGDTEKMMRVFAHVMQDRFDLCIFVLDIPRADRCQTEGYQCAIDAIIRAKKQTDAKVAVLSLLPENISETINAEFGAAGIVVLNGMEEGLKAIDAVIAHNVDDDFTPVPVALFPPRQSKITTLDEHQSKQALAEYGLCVPRSALAKSVGDIAEAANTLKYPVVLKGLGLAHKSEAGAVALGLVDERALKMAATKITPIADQFLIEEMVGDVMAELLIGITRDETGLMVMSIASGGIFTELIGDVTHLLLPAGDRDFETAIASLKIARLLSGYRGRQTADMAPVLGALKIIAEFALEKGEQLAELDVNPLLVSKDRVIAADALVRLYA